MLQVGAHENPYMHNGNFLRHRATQRDHSNVYCKKHLNSEITKCFEFTQLMVLCYTSTVSHTAMPPDRITTHELYSF